MQYEADQNMVFNYLMVSGLAAATDLFEKNGTGMTGGKSFNKLYCKIVKSIYNVIKRQNILRLIEFQTKCKKWL